MGVTRDLAEFATNTSFEDLPVDVVHAAKRDVINLLGVALYSARDPSLKILLDHFDAEGGNPRASVWGANYKTTLLNACLANGYTAHLEDYDDTHFPTVIHPSAPTIPAAWAIAESAGGRAEPGGLSSSKARDSSLSGRDLLAAVALGIEVCCRIGNALHPWHYDEGWHITGTIGVFGSAVAAGRLRGLSVDQMVAALGTAGTQAAGVREVFGTMAKAMHAGRAAQAGLLAAELSMRGFTSTTEILEGRRGIAAVMSPDRDLSRATEGLGSRWEIFQNGLKPYACGVVSHPSIDAAIAMRARPGFDPDAIKSIEARVHPLVPELMGRTELKAGLDGKFSVVHTIACGLVDGAAYPAQFSDARVADPKLATLRAKVRLVVEPAYGQDESDLTLTLKDGTKLHEHVEHASGAPQNPMTDARLEEKFLTLATPTLGAAPAKALLAHLWRLDEAKTVAGLL